VAVDTTWLDTINVALTRLGQRLLTAGWEADPTGKVETIVDSSFDFHLNGLVDDHPWHFLISRAEVAVDGTAPTWGPLYRYVIPADCVRVLEVNSEDVWTWNPNPGWAPGSSFAKWKTEYNETSRQIVCDLGTPLKIKYLRSFPSSGAADHATPLFKELLSLWIASQWAEVLTASDSLDQKIDLRFRTLLSEARSIASQEGTPDPIVTNTWENSRL